MFPGEGAGPYHGPGPGSSADDEHGPSISGERPEAAEDLRGALGAALSTGRQWIAEWLELLAIETRLGLRTLLALAICTVCAALAAITAWLALVAALCALVVLAGGTWPLALLGAALLNLAAALALWLRIRRLLGRLGFAASRAGAGLAPTPPGAVPGHVPGHVPGSAPDTAPGVDTQRAAGNTGVTAGKGSRAA